MRFGCCCCCYTFNAFPMQTSVIESTISTRLQRIMHENYKLHTITWSRFALVFFFLSVSVFVLFHLVVHEFVALYFYCYCCCRRRRRFNGSINKVKWWSYHRYFKIEMLTVCEESEKKMYATEWVYLLPYIKKRCYVKEQDNVSGRVWWIEWDSVWFFFCKDVALQFSGQGYNLVVRIAEMIRWTDNL